MPKGEHRKRAHRDEIVTYVCNLTGTSNKSLATLLKTLPPELGGAMEYKTWMVWTEQDPLVQQRYAQAKARQADFLAEEMMEIADETTGLQNNAEIQAARLRVDTRKWIASKLKPKKYGERVDLTTGGEPLKYEISVTFATPKKSEPDE